MSRLIVFATIEMAPEKGDTESFGCAFSDELRFSSRIGEVVLIADVTPGITQGYIAIGRLRGFTSDVHGSTVVSIEEITPFLAAVEFSEPPQRQGHMSELADDVFERIIGRATGDMTETQLGAYSIAKDVFSQQLRRANDDRCGFSDVATEQGQAFIIQPPSHGGRWHTSNFLFLDSEPGALFQTFAWTVGPRFEIIVDCHAVGPDISDTVNRTGMLAINDMVANWPDRDALAWHRQKFLARLGN